MQEEYEGVRGCKGCKGQGHGSAPCWQRARLDVGQHQPRLLYSCLAHERGELLERLLRRDLLSLVLGIKRIEPARWNAAGIGRFGRPSRPHRSVRWDSVADRSAVVQPGAWRASPRRSGCGTTKDGNLNVLSSLLCMSGSLTICFDSRIRAEQLTTTVPTSGAVLSGADMLGANVESMPLVARARRTICRGVGQANRQCLYPPTCTFFSTAFTRTQYGLLPCYLLSKAI